MSQNQIALPVPAEEESNVVEKFALASREIVPSVQVTLAKRIVKPGSNRVLCLAAHTTVPLSDDEISSVSNLALKLSDGTNIALSLSFFNDGLAADYVPVSRYIYEPERYKTVQTESRLGTVLVTILALAASGVFFAIKKPFEITAAKTAAKVAMVGLPGTIQKAKPLISQPVRAMSSEEVSQPKHVRTSEHAPRAHKSRASSSLKAPPRMRGNMNSILVPPPPPMTPTLPYPDAVMPIFEPHWQSTFGSKVPANFHPLVDVNRLAPVPGATSGAASISNANHHFASTIPATNIEQPSLERIVPESKADL